MNRFKTPLLAAALILVCAAPALAMTGSSAGNVSNFFTTLGVPFIDDIINGGINFMGGPAGWIAGLATGYGTFRKLRDAQEHGQWMHDGTLGLGTVAGIAGISSIFKFSHDKAAAASGMSLHHLALHAGHHAVIMAAHAAHLVAHLAR